MKQKQNKTKKKTIFKTQKIMEGIHYESESNAHGFKLPSIKMYTTINVIANKKTAGGNMIRTKPGQNSWDNKKKMIC